MIPLDAKARMNGPPAPKPGCILIKPPEGDMSGAGGGNDGTSGIGAKSRGESLLEFGRSPEGALIRFPRFFSGGFPATKNGGA